MWFPPSPSPPHSVTEAKPDRILGPTKCLIFIKSIFFSFCKCYTSDQLVSHLCLYHTFTSMATSQPGTTLLTPRTCLLWSPRPWKRLFDMWTEQTTQPRHDDLLPFAWMHQTLSVGDSVLMTYKRIIRSTLYTLIRIWCDSLYKKSSTGPST